jgi:hypothetical protein
MSRLAAQTKTKLELLTELDASELTAPWSESSEMGRLSERASPG